MSGKRVKSVVIEGIITRGDLRNSEVLYEAEPQRDNLTHLVKHLLADEEAWRLYVGGVPQAKDAEPLEIDIIVMVHGTPPWYREGK